MPPSTLTDSLIALKTQLERSLTEANTKASHLREQLSHVNALLLNQLLPRHGAVPQQTQSGSDVSVFEAIAPSPAQTLAETPAVEAPKPQTSARKPKATPETAPGKRNIRPLLPAYRGLTRLEAIAQLLQATPGEDVTTEQVSEGLFGKLSAADHKAERKSLHTQLYKGHILKLWQKGAVRGTFRVEAPTTSNSAQPKPKATKAKAPATTTAKRKSLTLLPAYAELSKGDAIAQVLGQYPGEVLHHDTIIQMLYGDLSPEELKAERTRIKTALLTGVRDGKWQKASVPSSYFLGNTAAGAKRKRPGRKPESVDRAMAVKPKSARKLAVAKTPANAKVPTKKAAQARRSEA